MKFEKKDWKIGLAIVMIIGGIGVVNGLNEQLDNLFYCINCGQTENLTVSYFNMYTMNTTQNTSFQCGANQYAYNVTVDGGNVTGLCSNPAAGTAYNDTWVNNTIQNVNNTIFTRINADNSTQKTAIDNEVTLQAANNNTQSLRISGDNTTQSTQISNEVSLQAANNATQATLITANNATQGTQISNEVTLQAANNATQATLITANNNTQNLLIVGNNNTLYALHGQQGNLSTNNNWTGIWNYFANITANWVNATIFYVSGIDIYARANSDNTTQKNAIDTEVTLQSANNATQGTQISNEMTLQAANNATQSTLINANNNTQNLLIVGNNNTQAAQLGQKLNLTGGTLSGYLNFTEGNLTIPQNISKICLNQQCTKYIYDNGTHVIIQG